jgi:hypothetical protein
MSRRAYLASGAPAIFGVHRIYDFAACGCLVRPLFPPLSLMSPIFLPLILPLEPCILILLVCASHEGTGEGARTVTTAPTAFWVDRGYDREYASDGISRYGAYLRDAAFEPWTDHDRQVEWAVFAWRRATGPVMSPGYVRYHARVQAAQLERSSWDGSLVADVTLVCAWPEQLTGALVKAVQLGDREAYWQDWPTECRGGDISCYYEPSEADVAARPYMLTTLSLQFTVPSATLPLPPATSGALLSAGQRAVAVVMAELNAIVSPLLVAGVGHAAPREGRAE